MQHVDALSLANDWTLWSCEHSTALTVPPPDGPDLVAGLALPLDVRTAVSLAKGLPDPRRDRDSRATDWVAAKEWWLATRFALPAMASGTRAFLRTRGCDDLAQVFVDGRHVGATESFNRTDFHPLHGFAAGTHDLQLRLWPCEPSAIESLDPLRVRRREQDLKSCMFHGGDHNPFLFNAGVAIAPRIVIARGGLLRSAHLAYAFTGEDRIAGSLRLDLDAWEPITIEATLVPENFSGPTLAFRWSCEPGSGVRALPVAEVAVARWMPAALGEPRCYRLTVRIADQSISGITGFRAVERRDNGAFVRRAVPSIFAWHSYENNGPYGQEYYKGYDAIREAGESWPAQPREGDYRHQHAVNGRDLFIMGGSVVPPTLFWSDWSPDAQRDLVRRAHSANLNTLRIWGGGYLLDDAFFAEADLLGVLIQHDFLNFAHFKDRSLSHQRRREREYRALVRAVGAHPSVITYNGGNELLQAPNRPLDPPFQAMARVVAEEAPHQLFHRSCPVNPEVHGPWMFDLDHAARYASAAAIFNSECGVMAVPSLKTLARTFSPSALANPMGADWLYRVCDAGYFRTLENNLRLFAPLGSLDAGGVARCTQWIQALGYQVIVEEHRRQQPATTGFTTWEYNEPWRDLNWGLLDSDLVPKHAFSSFRRAAAPRLVSARTPTFVYAPGAQLTAEIHLSGAMFAADVVATVRDAQGRVFAETHLRGSSGGVSACIGSVVAIAPAAGMFHLRLTARCDDGTMVSNDYLFCVLPPAPMERVRGLFISGGCYEDGVSLQFLRAAGFDLEVVHAAADRPLPQDVDPARYPLVVLAPVFNPLTALGESFIDRLASAVRAGTGLVYLAYNTSAYLSGRYAVDDLSDSSLEALLPVTFPVDCYRNSEDPVPGGPLVASGSHALWDGIDLAIAPDPGLGVRIQPRPDALVLARRADEPVLVAGRSGSGRVLVFTGGYGGHNYQGVGLRGWHHAHRLLANLCTYAARGTVTAPAPDPHAFAPLLALKIPTLAVRATALTATVTERAWSVAVTNVGGETAFAVHVGNRSPDEGANFDWHVDDDYVHLLPGETRTVVARAVARAGRTLPATLDPMAAAWPDASG
ncbi:MAG: hypothetical protein H0W72_08635 [Planctomycetes bacterium]|nr:hypothetical protein [Planctomycetota bacterium]